ncbi:DUF3732 domain-containing protein [Diaminobutyricibacter tongyongensis]|uniref:DUF3732 domain-containing protein n=1 Tax=Leifsonia tongyongensis TaxID=1268043 RepID=A0A6L9Y3R1_9MICO|nr:DUF3732 domain-containing protein [Diaminobutyricibacter tongyongensis]NEN07854.1 DUF3732 domain-containing protein [Diaminobutyricibacter tongyongensis]
MQLVGITIYSGDGRTRDVPFRLNQLNIVTGDSKTGKSSLLNIVDYCLGRKEPSIPTTAWFQAIAWYAAVFQFKDGSRALVAREAPTANLTSQRAMLELGGKDLTAPPFELLRLNTDTDALRAQIGARIGLADIQLESEASLRGPISVGLGSAIPYTLQEQHEIDSKVTLFHRQEELAQNLKDTIPFFLGAVDGKQAAKRAQLREARQALRRIENALALATQETQEQEIQLRELLSEARAVGLVNTASDNRETSTLDILNALRLERRAAIMPRGADTRAQDERRAAESQRIELSQRLNRLMATRDVLLDARDGEGGYDDSLKIQASRLRVLGLIPDHDGDAEFCPLCEQQMEHPDPTVAQLNQRLTDIRTELATVSAVRPKQQQALREVDAAIREVREGLNVVQSAIFSSGSTDVGSDPSSIGEAQSFVRGRIDATLDKLPDRDDSTIRRLESERETARALVNALMSELDGGDAREQLTSRLNALGIYLGDYSRRLHLEQSDRPIRLDVNKLTVVVDSETGPLPLRNIGSGENWVGYHLSAHLALHHFFLKQNRPVPRFLMLDQPSKAHFQSDRPAGADDNYFDPDREAVRNMFKLFADYPDELQGGVQLIVVDHANYTDAKWFTNAVVHNWREGTKLIPADWLTPEQAAAADREERRLRQSLMDQAQTLH